MSVGLYAKRQLNKARGICNVKETRTLMAKSIFKVHILSEVQKDLKKSPTFFDLLSNVK